MSAVLKSVPRPPRQVIYQTVEVEVEFDICDFDDEDLLAELGRRGLAVPSGAPTITLIYEAMAARNNDHAIELMRLYVMEATGRILP